MNNALPWSANSCNLARGRLRTLMSKEHTRYEPGEKEVFKFTDKNKKFFSGNL